MAYRWSLRMHRAFALRVGSSCTTQIQNDAQRKKKCIEFFHVSILLFKLLAEAEPDPKKQSVEVVAHTTAVPDLKIDIRSRMDRKPRRKTVIVGRIRRCKCFTAGFENALGIGTQTGGLCHSEIPRLDSAEDPLFSRGANSVG